MIHLRLNVTLKHGKHIRQQGNAILTGQILSRPRADAKQKLINLRRFARVYQILGSLYDC